MSKNTINFKKILIWGTPTVAITAVMFILYRVLLNNFRFDAVKKGRRVFLDLGRVGQNATLVLNGVDCGIRISRPYLFDITDAMQDGENIAEVVVSNTLAQRVRDHFSHNLQLSPSGLLGEMAIRYAD